MKQLRTSLLVMALLAFVQITLGQSTSTLKDTNKLKEHANQMLAAFTKGDFTTFASYTYPKVLKMMGGQEAMVKTLKKEMDKLKEEGVSIKSVSLGESSKIVKAGTESHALISQVIALNVEGGVLTTKSYLLAILPANATQWYFVDTAPLKEENLKRLFPDYNKELVIPAKQEPVFTAN